MPKIIMERRLRLLNKNFVLLWQGQIIGLLGTQAQSIAMAFWIKRTFDSATLMGVLPMLAALPAVLLSPVGGAVADRYSRHRIIVFSNAVRGLLLLVLAGLMFLLPEKTGLGLGVLFTVSILLSAISSFFIPAITAVLPDLVPKDQVARGNMLIQMATQGASLLGQGIGGVLFRLLGMPVVAALNGVGFVFAAISQCFITIPQQLPLKSSDEKSRVQQFREDIREGIRYVWHNAGLKWMVATSTLVNFFAAGVLTLAPLYVEDFLKVSADWAGYLAATFGVGTFIGFVAAGALKIRGEWRAFATITFIFLNAAGISLLGVLVNLKAAMVIVFCCGVAEGFITISISTIMQVTTPSEIRGRLFGLLGTLSGCIAPLGMGLSGIITDLLHKNVPLVYLFSGILIAVSSLPMALNAETRNFLAWEAPEIPAPEQPPPRRKRRKKAGRKKAVLLPLIPLLVLWSASILSSVNPQG